MDLERADRLAAEQRHSNAKQRDAFDLLEQIGYVWSVAKVRWEPKPFLTRAADRFSNVANYGAAPPCAWPAGSFDDNDEQRRQSAEDSSR